MIRLQVLLDDRKISLDGVETNLVEVAPGTYSVLLDTRSYVVRVTPTPDGYAVLTGDRHFQAQTRDPRNQVRRSRSGAGKAHQSLKTQMPGKVVRLLVTEGQVVEAGQGLLVVEAMKMQNEMRASHAGAVVKIHVAEGATVGAGAILVEIE